MLHVAWSFVTFSVVLTTFALRPGHALRAADDGLVQNADRAPWSYRAEVDDLRPIARSIGLVEDRPQDLAEEIHYRGTERRYGQLRYGSENSRRIVIVVDEIGNGEFDLFVDANRDRRITKEEILDGTGRTRSCRLNTEIIRADIRVHETRQVQMRLGATGTRLSIATLGCVEGEIPWRDATGKPVTVKVRRIDGNANGLFADSRDRLLIDVNHDGLWDRVSEQFAYLPVQRIAGRRYAVRSDRLGKQFSLSEITGVGFLRIAVSKLPASARVIAFEAMVFSDDGSAYSLKDLNDPLPVPIGRYTLGSVTFTITTGEGEPWHFVFSRSSSIGKDDWIAVAADEDVALEAIGKTRFELGVTPKGSVAPGDKMTVSPRLYTQDGLLINLSCRGRQIGNYVSERLHNLCEIRLNSMSGDTLSSARSGFA
jgi:hypothetical protein